MADAMLDARLEGDSHRRIEVISGQRRRRRWTAQGKARIVAESFEEGANISEVARCKACAWAAHGVATEVGGSGRRQRTRLFHLAVTPLFPAEEQGAACALGAERFEEFATQVARRVDLGVPLIREIIDRVSATRTNPWTHAEGQPSGTGTTLCEPDVQASSVADDASVPIAAVRADAGTLGLQAVEAALFLIPLPAVGSTKVRGRSHRDARYQPG